MINSNKNNNKEREKSSPKKGNSAGETNPFSRQNSLRRTPPVRQHCDEEKASASQHSNMNHEKGTEPRFLIIKKVEGDFFKTSPFAIQKALSGLVGDLKQIKKIRNGLLVETVSKAQSNRLQQIKTFLDLPVTVESHNTLNTCKGVIVCKDLLNCSEEEIVEELRSIGVIAVRRIKTRMNGNLQDTPSHILTFNTSKLPTHIKVAYHYLSVRQFIPAPLRCFKCQRYGHTALRCTHAQICVCGKPLHEGQTCGDDIICVNCEGKHNARSKNCPMYKAEAAIQKLKVTDRLSYLEAKKKLEINNPKIPTYAQVAGNAEIEKCNNTTKLVKELVPVLVETLKSVFITRQERFLTPDIRLGSTSSLVSDTTFDKRKRRISPQNEGSSDGDAESPFETEQLYSQSTKRPKGWPKGKPRKPSSSNEIIIPIGIKDN